MANRILCQLFMVATIFVASGAFAQNDGPFPGTAPPPSLPPSQQAPVMGPYFPPSGGPPSPGRVRGSPLRTVCALDVQRLCPGVQPGASRLAQCLTSHFSQLTPPCRSLIANGAGEMGTPSGPPAMVGPTVPPGMGGPGSPPGMGSSALPRFRAACAQDLRRLCPGVQPGGGRLIRCLQPYSRQLSPSCRGLIAAGAGPAQGYGPPPSGGASLPSIAPLPRPDGLPDSSSPDYRSATPSNPPPSSSSVSPPSEKTQPRPPPAATLPAPSGRPPANEPLND
jgi:hypothetical protein